MLSRFRFRGLLDNELAKLVVIGKLGGMVS